MAYRLKADESIPHGIRRIVREEMESAAAQLSGKGAPDRDEAIHEARKSVKKIRGVLRLLRPQLGDTFRIENRRMRDLARKLSQFRDAGAMRETLDAMPAKYRRALGKPTLTSLRAGLTARKEQDEQHAGIEPALIQLANAFAKASQRAKKWSIATDGFAAIAPGLEHTFRDGRKALDRVRRHPRAENYHEWRKRVKDHWYHIRLIEDLWSGAMRTYEKNLKDLETWLGEDHNLVVLSEKVVAEPALFGKPGTIRLFTRVIDRYHKELRASALAAGARIYEEKPRQFTRRIRRLWDARQK